MAFGNLETVFLHKRLNKLSMKAMNLYIKEYIKLQWYSIFILRNV